MGQTSQIGFGAMGATQSLVVETVGEQSETKAAGVVELFFRKAGKTRYLNAGECFIKEGEVVGSVFLVMGGEVLLKKQEKGSAEKLIATRSKGSLLGELSFMLGLPATVSAFAAPSKSSDPSTSSTPVTIIDVPQVKLMETLKSDPRLSGDFFQLLGATLAERITEISTTMRKAVVHSSQPQARRRGAGGNGRSDELTIMPESLEKPVREVAAVFGIALDSELVLHSDCVATIEVRCRV